MTQPDQNDAVPCFFSIVIPAHNEEGSVIRTCDALVAAFDDEGLVDYELVVVSDNSADDTERLLAELSAGQSRVRWLASERPPGFGFAVRQGIDACLGQVICIVMADMSDSPRDVLTCYREMKSGAECVFGSRFMKGSTVVDYPWPKLILNRLANGLIMFLFQLDHNDITNAFKCYRREVIDGVRPLLSRHFNLTIELPLKAIIRGYSFVKVPISWTNRTQGVSKLKIKEMGSRYLFIIIYILIEKWLARGDYRRPPGADATPGDH